MARVKSASCVGQRFGRLQVVALAPRDAAHRHVRFECLCECGVKFVGLAGNIRRGLTTSCGCLRRERLAQAMRKSERVATARRNQSEQARLYRESLVGRRFDRLLVVELLVHGKKARYRCLCDCGNEATTTRANLERGHTKSCGCFRTFRHPARQVGVRKLFYRYTFAAKRRGLSFTISLDRFRELTSQECHYCGGPPSLTIGSRSKHSEYRYNGVDRVDSRVGYEEDNIVPCCGVCNRMKADLPLDVFEQHVSRISTHLLAKAIQ